MGSFGLSGCCRSLGAADGACCWTCRFSITCVVEIFTTAGSTRLTIDANELDDGMASGMGSGVAPLPANAMIFMADVRPDTTVPIKIPTTSVSATNKPATSLFPPRPADHVALLVHPCCATPIFLSAAAPSSASTRTRRSPDYNTRIFPELPSASHCAGKHTGLLAGVALEAKVSISPLSI